MPFKFDVTAQNVLTIAILCI